ncbi:MAG: DUF853 domain-containing protein [Clostridia bacterium]|nr:DUF853 domain-containing protein [Clostridia bacterium]
MYNENMIWIGGDSQHKVCIHPKMANRHGFITGATGTGKTTTLRTMAESFSDCGVPVFLADVKGDLAGMCTPGDPEGWVGKRIEEMGLAPEGFNFHSCPVTFWDVYAKNGLPLRTTVSEMGPLLMSRILGLNATQEAVLTCVFKIADDEGLLLIDTKDLRSMLKYAGENAKEYSATYGNMSPQSIAAIVRSVVALEANGGDQFFGEPALDIRDWITTDFNGKGMVNILDCQELFQSPIMYGTFLLWMLSELYETLPEVGDLDKPRMVFFFDEAHLLFEDASKALLSKVEQVVKLIRSKGVGIYFITQSPNDIPGGVLAQLGNKVQHALRAYTPAEQKAVKAAAMSFRENPEFDTYETLQNLATGEALVSVLDEKGIPTIAERCIILPPQCGNATITDEERDMKIKQSNLYMKYSSFVDRDSAYEFLERKSIADAEALEAQKLAAAEEKQRLKDEAAAEKAREKEIAAAEKQREREAIAAQKAAEKEALAAEKARIKEEEQKKKDKQKFVKSMASTTGTTVGREIGQTVGKAVAGDFGKKIGGNLGSAIGRGILGGIFGKK